jgi:hypothetical protein
MTTNVNVNRQTILVAEREFSFDDFVSGVAKPLIYLKPGTRILRGWVDITTAWVSTTASLTIGDTAANDVDRWKTATDVKVAALSNLLAPLAKSTIDTAEAVTGTVTVTGTATAGAGVLHIEYTESSRSTEFHTYRG